jgi:hypothetical protein
MPGLKGALSIRVNDGRTDRIVTRYCRGLKFTKTAPGGHRDISFTVVLPRNTFSDLGPNDRVYVYDARTGRTVIEGYTENPTPIDGPDGQQYDVQAMGGMALASDETRALIYIDQTYDGWYKTSDSFGACTAEFSEQAVTDPFGDPAVHVQFNPGQLAVPLAGVASAKNNTLVGAGMELGGIQVYTYSGKNDGNYRAEFITDSTAIPVGASGVAISTTGASHFLYVVDNFTSTQGFGLRLIRTGAATNIADETTWTNFKLVSYIGRRMSRFGVPLNGIAGHISTSQVLASQIVEDLLGRLLTFCDPGTAQVDATTFAINQLTFAGGAKAADVLSRLVVFEPGYLWEILDSLDSGKHRFNYRAWPTTPRYEVSVRDGWKQAGSDVDLCNRILVTWTDSTGATQSTAVTAASLGLTGLGLPVDALGSRVKDADPITLPDGFGSSANATRIGGQILTDKINPPKAGTVVVRRPISDQLNGTQVMPWEIEPGYLCRVRETGDDLRITQVDYDDDNCEATLTLGTPVLSDEQRLARLDRAFTSV